MAPGAAASRREADMDEFATHLCPHRNVVLEITGGMHFSAGEVWDDIQERLLCLDCMEYITEAEIHAGKFPVTKQIIPLEVHHDHA